MEKDQEQKALNKGSVQEEEEEEIVPNGNDHDDLTSSKQLNEHFSSKVESEANRKSLLNSKNNEIKQQNSSRSHSSLRSDIRPSYQPVKDSTKKWNKWWKFGKKLDIFNFEPVPRTELVSTKRSQIGSISVILIFSAFVGFTLYQFFFNDTPILTSFETPINTNIGYDAQDFAFGFYQMDDSSQLINNSSLFTYYLEQYSQVNGEDQTQVIDYESCQPSWSPVQIAMLCPKQTMTIQGILGQSTILKYPSIKLLRCVDGLGVVCDQASMISLFPKGRLFVFMKQDSMKNFATGDEEPESGNFYYYFIVPNLYDRAEIILTRKQITELPNYATFFTDKVSSTQSVTNNNLYISNQGISATTQETQMKNQDQQVKLTQTNFNPRDILNKKKSKPTASLFEFDETSEDSYGRLNQKFNLGANNFSHELKSDALTSPDIQPLFQWWMSLYPSQINVQVSYSTTAQLISLWGGLWGVVQAVFTFIYMTHNANRFYKNHRLWDRFDIQVEVHKLSTFGQSDEVD